MARTPARPPSPPSSAKPEEVRATLSTQLGEETFTYYANHAEIVSLQHDFALLFARVPTKLSPEQRDEVSSGSLTLTCDVQILIPATLIAGLIRALDTQKASYERRYGAIHEPGASDAENSSE